MKTKDFLLNKKSVFFMVAAMLATAPIAPSAFAEKATVITTDDDDDDVRVVSTNDEDDGLFHGPLDVVGEVLALPFRLVANIFDGIF